MRIFFSMIFIVYLLNCVYSSTKPKTSSAISSEYGNPEGDSESCKNKLTVLSTRTQCSDNTLETLLPHVNVMITFTKAKDNLQLRENFKTTVKSLFYFASVPVKLYILGDDDSEQLTGRILHEVTDRSQYSVVYMKVDSLAEKAHNIISEMQKYFSHGPEDYYSDALFFLSVVMHTVIPVLDKVIMLDADLKFNADIKDLYNLFDNFSSDNIIGIGREHQPVYRHSFIKYRNQHKDTRVGAPPPDGLSGFNSGVLLLNLDRMRESKAYNSLISVEKIKELTEKYSFKGSLGDQDFYSLISLEHESFFYFLPCTWNKQLCEWWRINVPEYADVFDQYFTCEGHINIYHGNCNTKIPKLSWEET